MIARVDCFSSHSVDSLIAWSDTIKQDDFKGFFKDFSKDFVVFAQAVFVKVLQRINAFFKELLEFRCGLKNNKGIKQTESCK